MHLSLLAAPLCALLFCLPAVAQSSLGSQPTLPPPKPQQASPPATPPTPPRPPQAATAPAPQRPARTTAAPPPQRPATRQTVPVVAPPRAAQGPAARPASRQQESQPRPRAAAAGTAAGVAAGAAAGTAAGTHPSVPAAPAEPAAPPGPRLGSATGMPLPRYAALGSNQVNMRIGPDLRYPIDWTYQRKDLPVQIIDEFQHWRRIRDPEGTEGWVQRPLLTSRRTFLVQGAERVLRGRAEEGAAPVARLKPGVIGRLRHCAENSPWCEVQVRDYRGWLKRSEIWGVAPDEAVN